jgi:peptidoglycan/xylan/chitin deacetylase (PgdA/CDA1 family)
MKILGLLGIGLALAAAADASASDVAGELKSALRANREARSYAEWRGGGSTPEAVFARIAAKGEWAALCQKLGELSDGDLSFFEDAIRQAEPTTAFAECAAKLIVRVERYWTVTGSELERWHGKEMAGIDNAPLAPPMNMTLKSREETIDPAKEPVLFNAGLKPREIGITFDDGPHPTRTARLLRILKDYGVRATFFEVGEMAKRRPDLSRDVVNDGHGLGSHSMSHPPLVRWPFERAKNDIVFGHDAVEKAAGIETPFFRFPYGGRNKQLQEYVTGLGLASFFWNMDSADWKTRDPKQLLQRALGEVEREKGGIILFHDIQEQTIVMMPHFLEELWKKDFTTVVFVK